MGKCVDQVYFVEKWRKRHGLKISKNKQEFITLMKRASYDDI